MAQQRKSYDQQVSALESNAQLTRMYSDCLRRGWWRNDTRDGKVEFLAIAAHSVRVAEQPITMFYQMVRNGARYPIPEIDYDTAWAKYKDIFYD